MKKTTQWKQTYLLTYLFGWNRLQMILVLCFSAERIYACEMYLLPAACFSLSSSRLSTREGASTNYRGMQPWTPSHWEACLLSSSMVTSFGEISAGVYNYHELRGNGSLSLILQGLCILPPFTVSYPKSVSLWRHLLLANPNGHWQYKPNPSS